MADIYPQNVKDDVFSMNYNLYRRKPTTYDCLMTNHFEAEVTTVKEYEGRELYELLQNADDAGANLVKISLNGTLLQISNNGSKPFTIDGYGSIMREKQSTKTDNRYIGNKGLGFRSVLNWSSAITIKSLSAPNASTGFQCSFSQEIAKRKYEEIIDWWKRDYFNGGALPEDIESKLCRVAKKYSRPVPIAILSIPEVSEWLPTESVTTEIVLDIKSDDPKYLVNVRESMKSLTDSQFLLFTHNIKTIILNLDDNETRISICNINDSIRRIEITDNNERKHSQTWLVERIEEGNISVASARRIDVESDMRKVHHNYLLHNFFPTRIKLGFGCLFHATVELDNSRNSILTTPVEVFDLLIETTKRLIESIKRMKHDSPTWDAYDILYTLYNDYPTESKELQVFIGKLKELRDSLEVVPIVNGRYAKLSETIVISEKFSQFVEKLKEDRLELSNTIMHGYSAFNIKHKTFSEYKKQIESFASQKLNIELRTALIDVLARAYTYNSVSNSTKLNLLVDNNGEIILTEGHVMTGRKDKLPSILQIKIVHYDLVEQLIIYLKDVYDNFKDKENERKLVRLLQGFINIGYTDFSEIKLKLILDSYNSRTLEQEKELIQYLFRQWKVKNEKLYLHSGKILALLDKNGSPRQTCNLIANIAFDKWAPLINDFRQILGEDIEDNEVENFLINGIGMSKCVPMLYEDWGDAINKYDQYLNFVEIENCDIWKYRRSEVKTKDTDYRMCFVIDPNFSATLTPMEMIDYLLDDKHAYDAVVSEERGFKLFYFHYTLKDRDVRMSPAAFFLKEKLDIFGSYIIQGNEWLSEKVYSIERNDVNYSRFIALAKIFGAKDKLESLNPNELYLMIGRLAQSYYERGHKEHYQNFKNIIAERMNRGEIFSPPADLIVWCKTGERLELKKASECFYCNDRAPRSIMSQLPIFDIGSREGEDIVSKAFGVKKLSDIKIDVNKQMTMISDSMTAKINDIIFKRKVELIACRANVCSNNPIEFRTKINSALSNLKLMVCYNAAYIINIENGEEPEVQCLENAEFICDSNGCYWLVLSEDCNFQKNPEAIECVALILCNLFKIDEKRWANQLYYILKDDMTDLEFRIRNDYSEEYIAQIRDIVEGRYTPQKKQLMFDNIASIVDKIRKYRIIECYKECVNDTSLQPDFFSRIADIGRKTESECKDYFNDINNGILTLDEIEDSFIKRFELPEKVGETPKLLSCYAKWFGRFGNNFAIQQYPDLYSLMFFEDNDEEISRRWNELDSESDNTYSDETEQEDTDIEPIVVLSDGHFLKLDESEGEKSIVRPQKTIGKKNGSRKRGALDAVEIKAEKMVFEYIEKKGFNPIPRSSALDPTCQDVHHYDIEYVDDIGNKHYVDVKSTSTGIIYFSEYEYGFAKNHPEEYDLFIVSNGKVCEFPKAFKEIALKAIPETYKIKFILETDI